MFTDQTLNKMLENWIWEHNKKVIILHAQVGGGFIPEM